MRPRTVFDLTAVNGRRPKSPGEMLSVLLEQTVADYVGDPSPSPHPVGRAEVLEGGRLRIAITDHAEGRHAIAICEMTCSKQFCGMGR